MRQRSTKTQYSLYEIHEVLDKVSLAQQQISLDGAKMQAVPVLVEQL